MKHSENLDKFSKALAQVQSELEPLKKTADNPFLKTKYIPLDDIISMIRPILYKHGFSVVQLPVGEPGAGSVGLSTMLIHESDQWVEESFYMPIEKEKGKSLAQVAGSIISYARRYSLGAMVGIITDEDRDGNQPRPAPEKKQATRKPVAKKQYTDADRERMGAKAVKRITSRPWDTGANGDARRQGLSDAGKKRYWDNLDEHEKGVYRSLANLIPSLVENCDHYENRYAAQGAIELLFPALKDSQWPGAATPDEGQTRVFIYKTAMAYGKLREKGMGQEEAQAGAFVQAKNTPKV